VISQKQQDLLHLSDKFFVWRLALFSEGKEGVCSAKWSETASFRPEQYRPITVAALKDSFGGERGINNLRAAFGKSRLG
jgi:hypothetical protein